VRPLQQKMKIRPDFGSDRVKGFVFHKKKPVLESPSERQTLGKTAFILPFYNLHLRVSVENGG
jgi:hypothetical protein